MRRDTRELLINSAVTVLARDGVASIHAIIQEAGVSKSLFFHYFRSKQELLLAIVDRDFENRTKRLKATAKSLPNTPGRMLKAYVMVWVEDILLTGREEWNSLNVWLVPPLRERLAEQDRRLLDMLWDPGVPEMTVLLIVNACTGGWARGLVEDQSRSEIIESRKVLAEAMIKMIEDAVEEPVVDRNGSCGTGKEGNDHGCF